VRAAGFAFIPVIATPLRNLWNSFQSDRPREQVTIKAQQLRANPRFRQKKPRPIAPLGALPANCSLINARTGIVRYVAGKDSPTQPCIRGISLASLSSFKGSSLRDILLSGTSSRASQSLRNVPPGVGGLAAAGSATGAGRINLHECCASWAVEMEAEAFLGRGMREDGCRLILAALKVRPHELRLYDRQLLLACSSISPSKGRL
jgi:hypothetical protein